MLWILSLQLQIQPKAKEVFTYDSVKTGFVIHLKGKGGRVRILALKRRPDGIYLMSNLTVDLSKIPNVEMFVEPEEPIYSSNYPYTLTNGRSPEGVIVIQNLDDTPITVEKMEVEVR